MSEEEEVFKCVKCKENDRDETRDCGQCAECCGGDSCSCPRWPPEE